MTLILLPMSMPTSPVPNYFKKQPEQWGLRGDPHLWSELEARFAVLPLPATPGKLEKLLHESYLKITGELPRKGATPFVAKYDTGGMSSGMISADFWLDQGFPQIIQSYLEQRSALRLGTGLGNEAMLTIGTCALRFDGYAYAKAHLPHPGSWGDNFQALVGKARATGKFSPTPLENFGANYYLHRGFHGQGSLPVRFSPEWYDMAFYYLHLYRLPTPIVYRHESADDWDQRPKGAAERAAAELRALMRRHD